MSGVALPGPSIVPPNDARGLTTTAGVPGTSRSPFISAEPFSVTLSGSSTCTELVDPPVQRRRVPRDMTADTTSVPVAVPT